MGGARSWLSGLPDGRGLNIGFEAADRHALGDRADVVALRCLDKHGGQRDLTYADLARQTNRFANVLADLGVQPGERVFSLLSCCPELYVAALGTLKYTAVLSPLFPAFGPEPVRERLCLGDAAALVTTPEFYEQRVAPVRAGLPALRTPMATAGRRPGR